MKFKASRVATSLVVLFGLVITGCGGGLGVDPPPVANPNLTARPGLVVATNSPSWSKHLKSSSNAGVVVLLIQKGGPSDKKGLAVGDVITSINGEPSPNAERAAEFQFRGTAGTEVELEVLKVGKKEPTTIKFKLAEPGPNLSVRGLAIEGLKTDPNSIVLKYVLARQETGTPLDNLNLTQAVLNIDPKFVEALTRRGEIYWNRQVNATDLTPESIVQLRDLAIKDWNDALKIDRNNADALMLRSNAELSIGTRAVALRDARAALRSDELLPGAYNAVARAEYSLGNYEAAGENARKAIDLNPYNVRYYESLARAFAAVGDTDEAVQTVESIVDLITDIGTRERLLQIARSEPRPDPTPEGEGKSTPKATAKATAEPQK